MDFCANKPEEREREREREREAMPTLTRLYSMQEAAQHSTREDCWVVIDGKVYDVTKYLDDHPGGDDVLISATGRDSTEEFEDAGHSKTARELMKDYCVGEIDKSHVNVISELEIFTKEKPSNYELFNSPTLLNWLLPAALVGLSVLAAAVFYTRKK
ncbi:cytochrome b5 [Phalaenopsis equestris]|uniref:cytochrome b5 n=1 Tax=Phalaenopsis equestris TaxID=78828 RepID=UPI0009E57093|nr:cytochrome b5 [Phalaenopsis equestris]